MAIWIMAITAVSDIISPMGVSGRECYDPRELPLNFLGLDISRNMRPQLGEVRPSVRLEKLSGSPKLVICLFIKAAFFAKCRIEIFSPNRFRDSSQVVRARPIAS